MSADDISREDLRPDQIQYQLLTAQLAIGDEYDSAEDAPDGVNEAIAHIQTAMNLVSDPTVSVSDARPDDVELEEADQVRTDMTDRDWDDLSESEFIDIAHSPITDDKAFVFDHDEIGLHGFRWRSASKTLEAVSYNEVEKSDE